ncbi:CPBP family intramembrane glutamic endopeptidase [Acidobacteriota bacterium]
MSEIANRMKLFWLFYGLAVLIVLCVMLVGFVLFPAQATSLVGDYVQFNKSHNLYGNLYALILFSLQNPLAWLIILFAIAPTISAVVISLIKGGSRGLLELLSRFKLWREGVSAKKGARIYLVLFTVYFAYSGLFLAITAFWGKPGEITQSLHVLGGGFIPIVTTLFIGAFIDEGGTLEELGWRGFGLPILIDRLRNPLRATILLAFLWWGWHLPREIPAIIRGGLTTRYIEGQVIFLVLCLSLSVVITFFYNKTGGSVWPAILIHGGTNVVSKSISGPVNRLVGFDLRTLILFLMAMFIIIWAGPRLGRRSSYKVIVTKPKVFPA